MVGRLDIPVSRQTVAVAVSHDYVGVQITMASCSDGAEVSLISVRKPPPRYGFPLSSCSEAVGSPGRQNRRTFPRPVTRGGRLSLGGDIH